MEMQWTPEAVKAEVEYRRETARHGVRPEHLRALRDSRHPSWLRRLRAHPVTDQQERHAA